MGPLSTDRGHCEMSSQRELLTGRRHGGLTGDENDLACDGPPRSQLAENYARMLTSAIILLFSPPIAIGCNLRGEWAGSIEIPSRLWRSLCSMKRPV